MENNEVPEDSCKIRIFAHGCVELSFFYGDRYLYFNRNNQSILQPHSIITGQTLDYFDVLPTGRIGIISVMFQPYAAGMFFNIPISEIKNQTIPLEYISQKDNKELDDKLINSNNNKERIDLIEKYLIKRISEKKLHDFKNMLYIVNIINQNRGLISVKDLADFACLSPKQFERKFSAYVGSNPKQFIKTVRFQNSIYTKQLNPEESLTELAYSCGYYDQAHFNNEFKSFCGLTPREYFNSTEPFTDYFNY